MRELSIDFETASTADLRRTGAHAYARHPGTRVLCLAYQFKGESVQSWRPGQPFPADVIDHVARRWPVHGWNVGFEYVIWNHVLMRHVSGLPDLSVSQLRDTMARAAYFGLPLSLDQASAALALPVQKDAEGHKLMMRMNKPRGIDRATLQPVWWHETDAAKLDRLEAYCKTDVEVEAAIAARLPPLPAQEQDYWMWDQKINERGVVLDTSLVHVLNNLADTGRGSLDTYMQTLTKGAVPAVTATAQLLSHLREIGYPHSDLQKATIARRLAEEDCDGVEREILEVRADGAKTSTAKLKSMLSAMDPSDHRIRGMMQYYGASRTGRWAGRLVQVQNFPKGSVKHVEMAIDAILKDIPVDLLENFYGPPLAVVSSALRGCLVAAPGKALIVADFAQIEARVVAWLAGQTDILDVFRSGEDVYVYTANKIGSTDRQLGKVLVLACGFGMSGTKFRETAATYRVKLSEEDADRYVKQWRAANRKIVNFWWECDRVAKCVIENAVNGYHPAMDVGPVKFAMWQGHLAVWLPSTRSLIYRDAKITKDASGRDQVSYMGVDQYTRKWTRLRTYGGKLVENITQAVARDIMAEATAAACRAGIDVEVLVHDEIVAEAPADTADAKLADLLALMRRPPKWAPDLPVEAAGWSGPRYKK